MINYSNNLPKTFTDSDRQVYDIHSDFREWIRFESLILDGDIPQNIKPYLAIKLIFAGKMPSDISGAEKFITWFYCGGKTIEYDNNDNTANLESRRVYDFEYDAEYIISAFLELYNIDLTTVKYLHWWKFLALFRGLHDCKMVDIMGYRGAEVTDDLPKSRQAFLLDMQDYYTLPISVSEKRNIEAAQRYLNS